MGLFYFDSLESFQKKIPAFIAISFSFSILYNIIYFYTLCLNVKYIPLTLQDYFLSFQGWLVTLIFPIVINFLPDWEMSPNEDKIKIDSLKSRIDAGMEITKYRCSKELLDVIENDIKQMDLEVKKYSEKIEKHKNTIVYIFRIFSIIYTLTVIILCLIIQYNYNYRHIFIMNILLILSTIPYIVVFFVKNTIRYINVSFVFSMILVCSMNVTNHAIYDIVEKETSNTYFGKYKSEAIVLRSLENGIFVFNTNNTFSFIYNDGNHIDYKVDANVLEAIYRENDACYIEMLCSKN